MISLKSISSNKLVEVITINVMRSKKRYLSNVTREVEKKISSLNLLHTLEEKIKKLAKPIYNEVLLYYYYLLTRDVDLNPNALSKLFFKMNGKIDCIASTHKIVLDEHFPIKSRVVLACKLCFEAEILEFWKSQPNVFRELARERESTILKIWLKYLEKTEEPLERFIWKDRDSLEAAFLAAVDDFNINASEYFLKKMAPLPIDMKLSIWRTTRASVSSHHLPSRMVSYFVARMALFLANSLLKKLDLPMKSLTLKYEFGKNDNEILEHLDMVQNELSQLLRESELLWNHLNKSETGLIKNDNEMLEHEDIKDLQNEFSKVLKQTESCRNKLKTKEKLVKLVREKTRILHAIWKYKMTVFNNSVNTKFAFTLYKSEYNRTYHCKYGYLCTRCH